MYPQIPWELVTDPLGSTDHALRTTALEQGVDNISRCKQDMLMGGKRNYDNKVYISHFRFCSNL